jgi:lysozyme
MRYASLAAPFLLSLAVAGCAASSDDDEPLGETSDALLKKCGQKSTGPVQGYDVSVYQGDFDWKKAKADGRVFGIARVSSGTTIIDKTFPGNWAEMKENGFIRGAYQYFRPGQDANAQADLMIEKIGKLGPGDLPAMIDVETTDGQTPATVVSKVKKWMARVEAGTGKRPIIYTGAYFWKDDVGDDKSLGQYPLMIPNYNPTGCPLLPGGWTNWVIWQYGDGNGKLDHDVFNGTLTDLRKFAGLEAASPTTPGSGNEETSPDPSPPEQAPASGTGPTAPTDDRTPPASTDGTISAATADDAADSGCALAPRSRNGSVALAMFGVAAIAGRRRKRTIR